MSEGRFLYYLDPATGRKVDAPLLQEMVDDPVANKKYQETISQLAVEWGLSEEKARELFLKKEPPIS